MSWAWSDITGAAGPDQPQRQDHACAFDPTTGLGFLIGSTAPAAPHNFYTFDTATGLWTERTTAVFPERIDPICVWDPVNSQILTGFGLDWLYRNDLYRWTGSDWAAVSTGGSVYGAKAPSVSIDTSRGSMILFGGEPNAARTYELNLTTMTWSNLTGAIAGDPAAGGQRNWCQFDYDPVNDLHYLIGGAGFSTIWELDLNAMTWTNVTGSITGAASFLALPRQPSAGFYLPESQEIICMGGGAITVDVWLFDINALVFTQQTMTGSIPIGRYRAHFGFFDSVNRDVYIACGRHQGTGASLADTWTFETPAFPPVVTAINPTSGESGLPSDSTVNFTLIDNIAVADPWTVEIDRGGANGFELALTYNAGAVFEPQFQGADSVVVIVSGGYDVTIHPRTPFQYGQVVQVRVTAQDGLGNDAVMA